MGLLQIHPARRPGWRRRRLRQVVHSIPHYLSELRDIDSFREGIDWLYFKKPYLFELRKFPVRVTVEFTNHCNFACPYCPRSLMRRPEGCMDVNFFASLVPQLELGGCSVLKIGGLGEPVLHTAFPQMMKALEATQMKSILYTNGTLFRRFTPEQICDWNINQIVLSIDGLDPESFERQRKGGNYAQVRAAAENFAARRPSRRPIFEVRHVNLPNESNADLRAFRKDWLQIADTVKFNYLVPLQPRGAAVPTEVRCRDIRREAYVRWDGRLLLCAGQERQQPLEWLGDATKNSISELWLDGRIEALRSAHSSRQCPLPSCCQNCSFR
ncbi:MAG TPA: radical SAM protein [Candidatus Acidoferrum sp.]|nr:radical SAM protein [Candidatus Acidoferrum sp.]